MPGPVTIESFEAKAELLVATISLLSVRVEALTLAVREAKAEIRAVTEESDARDYAIARRVPKPRPRGNSDL